MRSTLLGAFVCVLVLAGGTVAGAAPVSPYSADTAAQSGPLPPGVTGDGVENSTALLDAHQSALRETGLTYRFVARTNGTGGLQSDATGVVVVGENASESRTQVTATMERSVDNDTTRVAADFWENDSVRVFRVTADNRTQYLKQPIGDDAPGGQPTPRTGTGAVMQSPESALLNLSLSVGEFTVEDTATVADRTLTTLRAESPNASFSGEEANFTEYNATVVVDETGLVHSLNLSLSSGSPGNAASVEYSMDLLGLGPTDPLKPAWAPAALATNATGLSAAAVTAGATPAQAGTEEPAVDADSLPPGVTEDGLDNATALLVANELASRDSGYAYRLTDRTNESGLQIEADSDEAVVVGTDRSEARAHGIATVRVSSLVSTETADAWGNSSVSASRYQIGAEVHYRRTTNETHGTRTVGGVTLPQSPLVAVAPSDVALTALWTGEFDVTRTTTVGNRTLTTLRAEEPNASLAAEADVLEYDATVVADEDGRIHSAEYTLVTPSGNESLRTGYSFDLLGVGSTDPVAPAWLPAALEATSAAGAPTSVDVSVEPVNDTFVVRNRGEGAFPANFTVEVGHANATHTLAVNRTLGAGESVYVYYPDDGSAPVLSRRAPAEAETSELAGTYAVTVYSPDGKPVAFYQVVRE